MGLRTTQEKLPSTPVSDHGALTGLTDDDHPQYHNDARGDARYSQLGHGHIIADVASLQSSLDSKVNDTGDTMTGALNINGSSDTQQLKVKAHSTQNAVLIEAQNNATTNPVFTVDKTGTLKVRNRVSGTDGRIELITGANPSVDIHGDTTNGYFPQINFYMAGIHTGGISGYSGILFSPTVGYSVGSWSYYQATTAFYVKSGYAGIHTVPLFEVRGYQGGFNPLGFWQDGSIKQYGTLSNLVRPLTVPTAVSAVASGSGSGLSAGTYYYKVTACNFVGETIGSNEVSVTITAGQNVTIAWTLANYEGVDHFRVYRATSAGGYTATSRIDTLPAGVPYYLLSLIDTGQTATTGTPPTALTHVTQTYRRWKGQTGAIIKCEDETGATVAQIKSDGTIQTTGDIDHDGTNVGFYGVAPTPRATGWTTSNVPAQLRTFDYDTMTGADLIKFVSTNMDDLKLTGILGA